MKKVSLICLAALAFRGDVSSQPTRPERAIVPPYRAWTASEVFKAGQRGCFVAVGSGATYLGGYVYDEDGNCVAWDDQGSPATRDDIAVVWYPSVTSRYTVELYNLGRRHNSFEYAIRP